MLVCAIDFPSLEFSKLALKVKIITLFDVVLNVGRVNI